MTAKTFEASNTKHGPLEFLSWSIYYELIWNGFECATLACRKTKVIKNGKPVLLTRSYCCCQSARTFIRFNSIESIKKILQTIETGSIEISKWKKRIKSAQSSLRGRCDRIHRSAHHKNIHSSSRNEDNTISIISFAALRFATHFICQKEDLTTIFAYTARWLYSYCWWCAASAHSTW